MIMITGMLLVMTCNMCGLCNIYISSTA